MRITQSMMTRNYLSGLNRNINNVAKSNQKLNSGRKFQRIWEDTAGATKAFTVRERLSRSEKFIDTIDGAQGELSSAESNLMSIHKLLANANEKILQGLNGATSAEAQESLAKEIGNIKDQILQLANSKFGEKFLFGGTNNSTGAFTDVDGKLHFNGIDVDSIFKNADGEMVYLDGAGDEVRVPQSMDRFLDIGLGMVVTGDEVNAKTAFQINTNGLSALGFGTNADGSSKNIINILGEVEKALRSPFDKEAVEKAAASLKKETDQVMMAVTDLGSRTSFLDQMKERFENDVLNLKTEQQSLEAVSLEEESIYNAQYNASWMVSLKLGSKLIPPSLFDFMN